jgi:5-methyltetrahydrofolate--homocysteine methyltransferase
MGYISFAQSIVPSAQIVSPSSEKTACSYGSPLSEAVARGLREKAAILTKEMLSQKEPLSIVEENIIPALNTVGEGFEKKTVFLPELLMSAEAAKSAFDVIKSAMKKSAHAESRMTVIMATVKGDIHDIGKNIVKLLLENYGFSVVDLGRDVEPSEIVEAAKEHGASVIGLSALMTTTVGAMEETISLVRKSLPKCRVMVGGAVLNAEYAKRIGADAYAKDAMEAVRCVESFEKELSV